MKPFALLSETLARRSVSTRTRLDKAAVVQAAAALADARGGIDTFTLADVADRLGIRVPSLYNHVAGLPGLQRDLALLGLRELTAQVRRAAIGKAGDQAITAIADAFRAFAHAHPGLYVSMQRAADPKDSEMAAAGQELVDVLLLVFASYHLQEEDALHVVRGLRSVVHGFVMLEATGGFGLPLDRDESFRRLLRMFIAGLHWMKVES
jgi:AcrR family transcriptional regulator